VFDRRAELIVLLGGEAGFRSGEKVALEWTDIDVVTGTTLYPAVPRGKGRCLCLKTAGYGMTRRLEKALREYRHLRGPRVLQRDEGGPLTEKLVQNLVGGAARKANL